MRYIFGFNYCCSRNCDREKCYAYVVKMPIIQKVVVDPEKKNFLITEFYWQDLESILISNSPL